MEFRDFTFLLLTEYFHFHISCDSERLNQRINVLKENVLLRMIIDRNFSCVYALSKLKTQIILETPEMRKNGFAAFHIMDDIFGNFPYKAIPYLLS